MGEFKAQILGIILVLGIFTALQVPVKNTFEQAWSGIYSGIHTAIPGTPATLPA